MELQKDSLIGFIHMIKKRTPMYIGGRSIIILKAFLDGWIYGAENEIKDIDLIEDFQKWVESKFKVKSNQSWAAIISFYSSDDYSALDRFFELWDEFLNEINRS